MLKWTVDYPDRLLSFIKKNFNEYSVKDIRWAIEHNRCTVNGAVERFCSFSLKKEDEVVLWPEKRPFFEFQPSRVLYEDDAILAYDKLPNIDSETLAKNLKLFLIHRLDRDTSGVILFAKSSGIQSSFQKLFRDRAIEKEYLAIVEGQIHKDQMVIEESMQKNHPRLGVATSTIVKKGEGLWSETHIQCLKKNKSHSLLVCKPTTGRTHQIRVHLKSIGHPVLGDYEYGKRVAKPNLFRPLLHAKRVEFIHPETKKKVVITAQLPEDFTYWMQTLIP